MYPALKRSGLSLATATLSFALSPAMAECVVDTYEIALGESIEAPLSPHLIAHIQKAGEEEISVFIFDDAAKISSYTRNSYWNPDNGWATPRIITTDINDDDIKELFVGTAQGMVNSYYWMLMSTENGKWHQVEDVSDPEFCRADRGYNTGVRSGPHWIETYWAIGENGIPYRKYSQTVVNNAVLLRVIYAPDGGVISQAIVAGDHDIFTSSPTYMACVAPKGDDAPIYDLTDKHEVARLKASTHVELVGVDKAYSMFLVEYGNGKRGWIMLEDISYK